MFIFFFIGLNLLIIISKIDSQDFPLILKFETKYNSILNPENYFELKYKNEPKVNIKVGTHHQLISCYLNINTYTIYISGSNSNLIKTQTKYEEFKSTKYQNISDKLTYESFLVYGIPSIDEINLNNEKTTQLKFYLAKKKFSEKELVYSCILGLGYEEIYNEEDNEKENNVRGIESFISQMKNNNIINKKLFFINYNKENDNGEITFYRVIERQFFLSQGLSN